MAFFIPCVELAALYPLVQMALVCNFYSIWPQNGRGEERKLQGIHERRHSVSPLTRYLQLDAHEKDQ